jgi:acyl-coenzyme A synthetase/AMP-(fatty) acid ligase
LSKGLKARDVVAMFMENRPAYIITWLGLAKVGVTSAWINSNNKMKPLIHSITICNAKMFLFGHELKDQVKPVLSKIRGMGLAIYDCGGPGGSPADSTFARSVRLISLPHD